VKRIRSTVITVLLLPVLLACGILNTAVNSATGGAYKPAAALWSDVPKMDGLGQSQVGDVPLPVKLLMRTILGNLGRLNGPNGDQTTGNIDWVSFDTTATPSDIQNFYTNDRMSAAGWDNSDGTGCFSGSEQGAPDIGTFCVFGKTTNGLQTFLAIIATEDQSTQKTTAFFLRLDEAATPTP
jgi:hypothetical protein